ncbi:dynein regulatory complex protein 1 [Huso huso]|uniref:Dynein regulatory complex protein 1 n=1 Tax=Huso huso TaxID=61971 RepID=A0ABR0ZUP2_HUSHU
MDPAENGSKEPEPEESVPSVESDIPEERIAARRLRIAARIEAKKREALGVDPNPKKEVKQELKSEKQVEQSRQRLTKLKSDGTELVTNIQVAADSRESQRRTDEAEARRQRTERLESEAKMSLEKFEDITKKWTMARSRELPQDLWEILNMQQQQCALLIEDKNKLINDLQQELKASDDRYVKDLKKQAEDIDLMIERMEEQIKNLMKSYREELNQIEKSFELERRELLDSNHNKWEQMMQCRRDKELQFLMMRMKRVEEQERQLQQLRVQDAEEYNMIKIKLETDVQILEQQLQQMKATYQLNQEKLEYNFQVLKKRDEENTITKSQQKRKITRLQDILNNVRIKHTKQDKQFREENHGLTEDYKRIMEQYKEMQKKMKHFANVDAKKFQEIWLMNEEEVKELVQRALETDRIIHEQQLGLAWEKPHLPFMERSGPIVPEHEKKKLALQLAEEVIRSKGNTDADEEWEAVCAPGTQSDSPPFQEQDRLDTDNTESSADQPLKISVKTIKRLLEILCDETGFLIESKLLKLLSPLEKDEQSLMKLDAIFMALGIENEEDVYKLADFFIKYREQQTVDSKGADEDESPGKRESHAQKETGDGSSHRSSSSDLIHPNDVLQALRGFTKEHFKPRDKSHQQSKLFNLNERDDSKDAAYWEDMVNVIPEAKLKVWDALYNALEKYHHVLTERMKLINETNGMKQQNSELRMLLHQYVNSRVNAELEIPPTQVMQVESSWN